MYMLTSYILTSVKIIITLLYIVIIIVIIIIIIVGISHLLYLHTNIASFDLQCRNIS